MNYNRDLLERIQRELENDKIRLEAEAEARKTRVYSALPRIAEIDSALRGTALDIIRASFGKAEDCAALIRKTKEKNLALRAEREEILKNANIPFDFAEVKYSCEACEDSGFAGGGICKCMISRLKKAEAQEINSRLNLPDADFARFDISLYPENGGKISPRAQMREVYDFCRNYAEGFGDSSESLFMNGGPGLGKSFLASCIAKKAAENDFSVIYDTAFSILGTYEDIKFGRSEASTLPFETCELLIIDDLGCEMATPFSVAALFNLINLRRNANKKTIIISSLPIAEIKKRYGAQLYSRLCGDFIKLEFLGEDIRLLR